MVVARIVCHLVEYGFCYSRSSVRVCVFITTKSCDKLVKNVLLPVQQFLLLLCWGWFISILFSLTYTHVYIVAPPPKKTCEKRKWYNVTKNHFVTINIIGYILSLVSRTCTCTLYRADSMRNERKERRGRISIPATLQCSIFIAWNSNYVGLIDNADTSTHILDKWNDF